jgi:DNA-binding GntR family transcriptional regulator
MQLQTKAETLGNTKKSLHETIRELMTAIATGTFKPGERLVELQLCEFCDVKRSRIREALRKLEHDGFVKIVRNVGAVVSKFSRQDIVEMYDLLSVVEGMAVRIATPFITPDQLKHLQIILEKSEATDDVSLFTGYNNEFHHLLDSYCENRRLMKVAENLRLNINAFGFRSFLAPGQIAVSMRDHKNIMQAIKDNKPEKAEKLMRQHLIDAKNRLLGWIYKTL